MRYTLTCPCGAFFPNLNVYEMGALCAAHPAALLYPADLYAEMANDTLAEADWVISP